jgi:hypothetical protein
MWGWYQGAAAGDRLKRQQIMVKTAAAPFED